MRALAIPLVLVGAAAIAAPPPPAIYPSDMPKEVAGYRMDLIYPRYHFWLNSQRKAAIVAAPFAPVRWKGLNHWNSIVASEVVSYDFGIVRADRLDRFCEGDMLKREQPGRCEYRYAYAVVPGSPYDANINDAIAKSYRPTELARRLTALGWKQPTRLWGDKTLLAAFEAHVDTKAFYKPMVRTTEVDASSCPALAKSIAELGKVTFDFAPQAVTKPIDAMPPHGSWTEARLTMADTAGRTVIIEGATPLHAMLKPIWDAVEGCAPADAPQ